MKTFVIQLESHDDVVSARDKISWNKSPRILLVWPVEGGLFQTRFDLLMLQRACRQMGGQIGIVCTNPVVIQNARELRIPVFSDAMEAQQGNWRRARYRGVRAKKLFRENYQFEQKRRLPDKPALPKPMPDWLRWGAFVTGMVAFVCLVMVFIPGARVTLVSPSIEQNLDIPMWASPDIPQAAISGGVPAQSRLVSVEGRGQVPSTSTIAVPEKRSEGWVRLTNLTDKPVTVPAGTVVATLGSKPVRFSTNQAVFLEAGSGKFVEVSVTALQGGGAGNVALGSIEAVEGGMGLQVSVTNPLPMRGGSETLMPAPGLQDQEKLRAILRSSLQKTALGEVSGKLNSLVILVPGSLKERRIIEELLEPAAGIPAESLKMTLRIEYEVWTVSMEDVNQVARMALDANIPDNYHVIPETLGIHSISPPEMDSAGYARWAIKATRRLEKDIPPVNIVDWITNLTPQVASNIIMSKLELESPPKIEIFPGWWGRLPFLPLRIEVNYQ